MKGYINTCLALARVILGDTKLRRQWIFYLTLGVIAFIYVGLRPGITWWKDHAMLFAFFLLSSLIGALLLLAMAMLDMLLVMKSYRDEKKQAARALENDIQSSAPHS